jgi:TonB family protein
MRLRSAVLAASLLAAPAWPQGAEPTPRVAGSEVPAPKRTKFVSPQYPADAQARGLRGIVILELIIDTEGKVAAASVTRSVPPFDEAALVAARQWEYEVTRVDGKPVTVRLSVPITFTMPVPRVSKQEGIPELIQGVNPAIPAGAQQPASVVAELTLEPTGQVSEIEIKSGETVFADALMDALRTWRFAPGSAEATVAFRVEADFVPGKPGRVDLRLAGLRQSETVAAASPEPAPSAAPPSPAPSPAVAELAPSPAPAPAPTPAAAPATTPPPVARPSPMPTPEAGPVRSASNPAPPPASPAGATAGPGQLVPPSGPPVETLGPVSPPPTAAPAAPPQLPPVSAVRDVTLEMGVPDLTRGRRPVVPPLARMASTTGSVDVHFAVDASGTSSVQEVAGPELLKEAARQAVLSWVFRRTTAERLHLVASFVYGAATANATVRRDE